MCVCAVCLLCEVVCMYVCVCMSMYVCKFVCRYVCMYVCMYVEGLKHVPVSLATARAIKVLPDPGGP